MRLRTARGFGLRGALAAAAAVVLTAGVGAVVAPTAQAATTPAAAPASTTPTGSASGSASGPASQPRATAGPVTVSVLSVNPISPPASATPIPLTFRLQLHNTTGTTEPELQVTAQRGDPISDAASLQQELSTAGPRTSQFMVPIQPTKPVTVTLPPNGTATVTFSTTIGLSNDGTGLCECHAGAIYPMYFTAANGGGTSVGTAETFLPIFDQQPKPTTVSWLWPLLERPHRLTSDNVFIDDDLATSVATGGRLDRMLQVVQNTAGRVPMTLVIDPELLEELQVMSTGHYQVRPLGSTQSKPGRGAQAATAWLQRLSTVLATHPKLEVDLTAPGDPAVADLLANHLDWSAQLSAAQQASLRTLLGGRTPQSDIAWPTGIDAATLDSYAQHGASTVVLSDSELSAGQNDSPPRDALAPLSVNGGQALVAGVLSTRIQNYVGRVLTGGAAAALLPQLVAEVAIAAAQDPSDTHYVLLAAPRNLDPSVSAATNAILQTAGAYWASPLGLRAAAASVHTVDHGTLTKRPAAQTLTGATVSTAQEYLRVAADVNAMITSPAQATQVLSGLPAGVQRLESNAWSNAPKLAVRATAQVANAVSTIGGAVFLVRPSTSNYTLASSTSPLPVTVENNLPYPVMVQVRISSRLAGFATVTLPTRRIDAHQKATLHVPTKVQRSGQFPVLAQLQTPDDRVIGSIALNVHSTALGVIGIVITIVSGVLLLLALVVRYRRRAIHRRRAAAAAAGSFSADLEAFDTVPPAPRSTPWSTPWSPPTRSRHGPDRPTAPPGGGPD